MKSLRLRELAKGQTMTEYAMIVATVAIVLIASYQVLGQDVISLVNNVDTLFTAS